MSNVADFYEGLAARGFHVTASDISPGAIARARFVADRRQFQVDLRVDDFSSQAESA